MERAVANVDRSEGFIFVEHIPESANYRETLACY